MWMTAAMQDYDQIYVHLVCHGSLDYWLFNIFFTALIIKMK